MSLNLQITDRVCPELDINSIGGTGLGRWLTDGGGGQRHAPTALYPLEDSWSRVPSEAE